MFKNQDYANAIAARLSELRSDTAQLQVVALRLVARNVLRDFDFYRSARNTIDLLRQEATKSGESGKGSDRLAAELASTKQQVVTLQAALAGASGGGGGGGGQSVTPLGRSGRLQLELLRDQLAFAQADCERQRALDLKLHSKKRRQMLESSRTAFIQILQDPATNDLKQSIEQTLAPINVELGREPRFFGLL
jgi:hypothetical protein